jgi:V/A-type H+-transporting ATPase subunit D
MEKVRFTRVALKEQRERLSRFLRFLPTLRLRKAQLFAEVQKIRKQIRELDEGIEMRLTQTGHWVAVFSEDIGITALIGRHTVRTGEENIAGVIVPTFLGVTYESVPYDYAKYPLWVDRAVDEVVQLITLRLPREVLVRRAEILQKELDVATQRVNLFEKVLVPQAEENIRQILVYLGDEQTAAVVCGKMAKKKIEERA